MISVRDLISDRPIHQIIEAVDEAAVHERQDDCCRGALDPLVIAPDHDVRLLRRLVSLVDAREVLDLAGQRFLVEALGVAFDAGGDRRVDEDFDELALGADFPR